MTVAEFIAARLDDDEHLAGLGLNGNPWLMRKVTAMRAILAMEEPEEWYSPDRCSLIDDVLRTMAAIWSDHPDYEQVRW